MEFDHPLLSGFNRLARCLELQRLIARKGGNAPGTPSSNLPDHRRDIAPEKHFRRYRANPRSTGPLPESSNYGKRRFRFRFLPDARTLRIRVRPKILIVQ